MLHGVREYLPDTLNGEDANTSKLFAREYYRYALSLLAAAAICVCVILNPNQSRPTRSVSVDTSLLPPPLTTFRQKSKKPCVFKGLASRWPALRGKRKWSFENLREHYGDEYFLATNESSNAILTMEEFLELHVFTEKMTQDVPSSSPHDANPLYLFDPTFDDDNAEMLDAYQEPGIFSEAIGGLDLMQQVPLELQPDYRWLLVGGTFSGSHLHIDPLHSSAWNTLLVGEKLWALIPPEVEVSPTLEMGPGGFQTTTVSRPHTNIRHWFQHDLSAFVRSQASHCKDIFIFRQQPGETVFVPAQWQHAVLNLVPSVAITHNLAGPDVVDQFLAALETAWLQNETADGNIASSCSEAREKIRILSGEIRKRVAAIQLQPSSSTLYHRRSNRC
jgi:hypothetical protein